MFKMSMVATRSDVSVRVSVCRGGYYGDFYMFPGANQGCQMVYFRTKNPNFGKLWRSLESKMLVYILYGL
jgi:hypothetical protein